MAPLKRDIISLSIIAVLAVIVWRIHYTSLAHEIQRPLKIVLIIVTLIAVGWWREREKKKHAAVAVTEEN